MKNLNTFNPHSSLASFYRYFYLVETTPNNLCDYFWKLLIALICFPFVWPAMAINRYNKVVWFDTALYNIWEYDEVAGHNICRGEKPLNRYRIRVSQSHTTAIGALYSLVFFIAGIFSSGVLYKFFHIDLLTNGNPNVSFHLLYMLYITGVICIFSSIGLFFIIVAVCRFLSKFKKQLSQEEKEALYLANEKRYVERSKRCQERRARRQANPNFIILLFRWFKAIKEKNCPIIEWDYDNNLPKKK